jgi:hypothetical protein
MLPSDKSNSDYIVRLDVINGLKLFVSFDGVGFFSNCVCNKFGSRLGHSFFLSISVYHMGILF